MKNKIFLLCLTIFLFTSCGSYEERISYDYMSLSKLGDPITKYNGESNDFPIQYEAEYTLNDLPSGNEYKLLVYEFDLKTAAGNLGSQSVEYTLVIYAFEDDKLAFFGFPENFLKSSNDKANEIGLRLAEIIRLTR